MADNSNVRLLRYYILKLKSFLFSKDVLSFLLFLVLASGFWFVNALDKERETEISIPLRFVSLPKNIAIINDYPANITIKVKDKGINLFTYTRPKFNSISFDLGRVFYEKGEITISSDQIRAKLARILLPSTSILEIKPNALSFHYESLDTKVLSVEFDADIELAHQYILSDEIQISPATITVFGPKSVLDKMTTIKTESVELAKLSDTTHLNCKLLPVKSVKFANEEVKVSIFVEMFTEKKMQLPVTVINCPENKIIRTFPAFVNVSFNVGMSHFNSVKQDDLMVLLDYNEIAKNNNLKQRLRIENNTSFISNLKAVPQEVEYIIEMK